MGFAAGGLIAACWVSAELGVVTLVWAPACVRMRRSRGRVCGGVLWGFLSVILEISSEIRAPSGCCGVDSDSLVGIACMGAGFWVTGSAGPFCLFPYLRAF